MKKINSILGFAVVLTIIVMVGSLAGLFIHIAPNIYWKMFFGAIGMLLIISVIWSGVGLIYEI